MATRPASVARFLDRRTPPHLITLVLIAGLSSLTMTIFLPGIPEMAAYFDAEYAVVQLSVSAYLGTTGVLQLLIGPLADRYGRRPVLLIALAIFCLATVGVILAPTVEIFLICRLIQAVVSTGLVLSRAIVRDMVSERDAAAMLGFITMCMAVLPMLGPSIGGALQSVFDWKASFVVLLIVGAVTFFLVLGDLGETGRRGGLGFRAQVALYPTLLSSRRFWGYSAAAATASGCFFAFLGGAPFVADVVIGMGPTETGIAFAIIAFGYMVGNFLTSRLSARFGLYRLMLAGAINASFGMALALVLYAAGVEPAVAVFGPTFFVGLGNGLLMPTAQSGALSVKPELAGTASGLSSALLIGGGAILSAITAAMLTEDAGAYPMILMMLGIALASIIATLYTGRVEIEMRGELP